MKNYGRQVYVCVSTRRWAENESPSRYIEMLSGENFREQDKFELI